MKSIPAKVSTMRLENPVPSLCYYQILQAHPRFFALQNPNQVAHRV